MQKPRLRSKLHRSNTAGADDFLTVRVSPSSLSPNATPSSPAPGRFYMQDAPSASPFLSAGSSLPFLPFSEDDDNGESPNGQQISTPRWGSTRALNSMDGGAGEARVAETESNMEKIETLVLGGVERTRKPSDLETVEEASHSRETSMSPTGSNSN